MPDRASVTPATARRPWRGINLGTWDVGDDSMLGLGSDHTRSLSSAHIIVFIPMMGHMTRAVMSIF